MGGIMRVIGAIDVALWDLAAKAAGVPVHRLMGSFRESVPAYASSAVFENPEEYAEEAVLFKEKGWSAYKIHPPAIPELDIKICEAVRLAVGEDPRTNKNRALPQRYLPLAHLGNHKTKLNRA